MKGWMECKPVACGGNNIGFTMVFTKASPRLARFHIDELLFGIGHIGEGCLWHIEPGSLTAGH
jgi:hypothetical protein